MLRSFPEDFRTETRQLVEAASAQGAVDAVVVDATKPHVIASTLLARDLGILHPILVGDRDQIHAVGEEAGSDLAGVRLVEARTPEEFIAVSLEQLNKPSRSIMVKGALRTDHLMKGVLRQKKVGERTARLSHAFLCLPPPSFYHKPVIITDGALNVAPDLDTKFAILANAMRLTGALGIKCPKVALLSATEAVSSGMESTLHAAALSVGAQRDRLDAIVEGPLALDVAFSADAALVKNISSEVAGDIDVLLVSSIEVGNSLVKLLLANGAVAGGVVIGGAFPIVLPSRSDSVESRLLGCAVASLVAAMPAAVQR